MKRRRLFAVALLASFGGVLATAIPAGAAPPGGGAIQLDRSSVQLGQRLYVTLSGWKSRNVTISVCGNLAVRGTSDCNLPASQALKLLTEPTITQLTVFAPPGTCPCVIRASDAENDEVAVAPIDIIGVPTGPVVGAGAQQFIAVSVTAGPVHEGIVSAIRSALGGPTAYLLDISVRNLTARRLSGLTLNGTVADGQSSSVTSFDISSPGVLLPGATWSLHRKVKLPAPALGTFSWTVTVSGVGSPTSGSVVNRHVPLLFVLVVVVFVADVIVIIVRYVALRIRQRRGRQAPSIPSAIAPM